MPYASRLMPNAYLVFLISYLFQHFSLPCSVFSVQNVFHIYTWTKSHIFIFSHSISYLFQHFSLTLQVPTGSVGMFSVHDSVFKTSFIFPHGRSPTYDEVVTPPRRTRKRHILSYFKFCISYFVSRISYLVSRPPRRIQCSKRLSCSHMGVAPHTTKSSHTLKASHPFVFHPPRRICISYLKHLSQHPRQIVKLCFHRRLSKIHFYRRF